MGALPFRHLKPLESGMRFWHFGFAMAFVVWQSTFLGGLAQQRNPHVADTPPLPPHEQLKKFHVPPGFAIQLVAAEPHIKKPINIAFDAQGRLWVTGSEEYPFAAPPDRKPKDKLVILEDFGPDGRARKSTVFADGLNIPIGVLPMPDCKSAIVFSIPNIWKMTDNDGDGVADKRDLLYTGYGYKDTHGMTGEFMWGFDGWIYCCHGYANASKVKSRGDTTVAMQSGNTYRIKPDGSRIEQYTWGQVNPFGLAFDPLGNLYSADCHSRPVYQLLKGAYYPSFGKPHDGLGFAPEMVTHDHGSTAIAGIAYYAADHYPKEFHDNIFIGNVMTNRINRDRIEWHGSTPKGIAMPDFVKCDDPWFRPVDIKLGPDGALYVADFYNRIIGHYEVPLDHPGRDREKGRIWRIVYAGKDGKGKPKDYRSMPERTVEEVVAAMADPNLAVRIFATNDVVARGGPSVRDHTMRGVTSNSGTQHVHALWALERMGGLSGEIVKNGSESKDRLVRVHTVKILGERKNLPESLRNRLNYLAHDGDFFVRRAAAEALGAHPSLEGTSHLAFLRGHIVPRDTHMLHVYRMALRNQWRDPVLANAFNKTDSLKQWEIEALLDACVGMPSAQSARFLLRHGLRGREPAAISKLRVHHVVRYGTQEMRQELLEKVRERAENYIDFAGAAVKAVVQATQERGGALNDAERSWAEEIVLRLLQSTTSGILQDGIDLAASMKIDSAQTALIGIATSTEGREPHRKSAIAALVAIEPRKHVDSLGRLLLDANESIGVREQVASSLAGANQPEAYAELIQAFENAPARLQTAIALGMAGSPQGGAKLLDAVAAGKASARLLQDRAVEAKLKQAKIAGLDQRLAKLTKGLPPADQRAQELIAKRQQAFAAAQSDAKEGRKLFEKHCAACHIIANQGSKIGPQLDGIGVRGVERLLEDLLDPSRNIDQLFRATTLELDNGQFITGLLLREEGKVLVLADNQGKEVRVEGAKVVNRSVGQLSPMPANLFEQIPEAEFHHLMAFLLEQRPKQ
jgi:putative heme-binding domain-containing protein